MAQRSIKTTIGPIPDIAVSRPSHGFGPAFTRTLPLVLSDLFWLTVAIFAAYLADGYLFQTMSARTDMGITPWVPVTFLGFSSASLIVAGAYQPSGYGLPGRELSRTVGVISFAVMLVWLFCVAVAGKPLEPEFGLAMWGAAVLFLVFGRAFTRQTLRSRGLGSTRVILIGDPQTATPVIDRLNKNGSPVRVMGTVAPDDDLSSLPSVLSRVGPAEIMVAVPSAQYPRVARALKASVSGNTTIRLALDPLIEEPDADFLEIVQGVAAIRLKGRVFSWQYERIKRAFDIFASSVALFMLAPFMVAIAVAIKLDSPGPILFKQTRVGRDGRAFGMYKFRSMKVNAEAMLKDLLKYNEASGAMFKMKEDPRITRVGRIIRKLSLDELPQFLNVLNGTMSLVGPRPPLPNEVKVYEPWHFQRLEAVPGITGLWQVSRGPEILFDEMVRLDMEYIHDWSMGKDIAILLRTVPTVLTGRGAY